MKNSYLLRLDECKGMEYKINKNHSWTPHYCLYAYWFGLGRGSLVVNPLI